jgi:hydroxysqualene dehydroxylase
MKRFAVIGGGWAGLAAAAKLAHAGHAVDLFEMAPQLGGRARNAVFRPHHPLAGDEQLAIDNGQHLLMGAYSETIALCKRLAGAARFDALFDVAPVTLANTAGLYLQANRFLPAPLHLAAAMVGARGLSLRDRWAMIAFLQRLKKRQWLINEADISVSSLLKQMNQTDTVIQHLWRPLCLSALNTLPDLASAKVFCAILRDTLAAGRQASDFLVARVPLGETLPKLVQEQLSASPHRIFLKAQVLALHHAPGDAGPVMVQTQNERANTPYSGAVVATPWFTTQALLDLPQRSELAQLPIVTVYLYWRTTAHSARQRPLMLADDPTKQMYGHWLFDLGDTNGGGRLASVVISGPGEHLQLSREALAQAITTQISTQVGWLEPDDHFVITEKRATFACTVNVDRPDAQAHIPARVALAGDYFRSEYPATLETAVRSGLAAAQRLLNHDLVQVT